MRYGNGSFYTADPVFSAIAERQGFDGKPSVVSPAEMDRLVADGRPAMFRAASEGIDENDQPLSAAKIQEQLRTGPARFGDGQYGSGFYFSGDENDAVASYGDGTPGSVAKAVLKPDARHVNVEDLLQRQAEAFASGEDLTLAGNLGRLGAAQGYDVIDIPGENPGERWHLVLNRTALIVEDPNHPDAKLSASRARQAQIDDKRKLADLTAEVQEIINNGGDPERNSRALGRRHNLTPEQVDEALSSPDAFAAANGLTPISGPAGSVEPFDPKRHSSISSGTRRGQMVEVIRPGYSARVGDEDVVLDKAKVDLADETQRSAVDDDQLHHYWTRGEGLAKWRTHPHPWTALRNHLRKHVPQAMANRMASQWFKEVFGYWPGSRKGTNPVGPG